MNVIAPELCKGRSHTEKVKVLHTKRAVLPLQVGVC